MKELWMLLKIEMQRQRFTRESWLLSAIQYSHPFSLILQGFTGEMFDPWPVSQICPTEPCHLVPIFPIGTKIWWQGSTVSVAASLLSNFQVYGKPQGLDSMALHTRLGAWGWSSAGPNPGVQGRFCVGPNPGMEVGVNTEPIQVHRVGWYKAGSRWHRAQSQWCGARSQSQPNGSGLWTGTVPLTDLWGKRSSTTLLHY